MDDSKDIPGVIAPPPLIFAGSLLAVLTVSRFARLPRLPAALGNVIGGALLFAAGAFGPPAFLEMRKRETNVSPYHPSKTIVDTGPFGRSRNPLYLSMALLYAGIALLSRNLLALVALPGVVAIVQRGVIEREEIYLERKFGSSYLEYKSRVRRWF